MRFLLVTLIWILTSFNDEVGSSINRFLNPKPDIPKNKSIRTYAITGQKFASCAPISPLPCDNIIVSLPLDLSFNGSVSNTITDKNSVGTGFTMVDAYSGTRLSADGTPENTEVPGYQASKLTLGSGRLQILSNKGVAYLSNNNQLNTLGVKFDSKSRFQVEAVLVNPFNGTSAQQGGIWVGQNDKTFLKLVVIGSKVEFRKEVNDVSGSSDMRITGTISGLETKTVNLRLIIDPVTNIAEAYYSLNGIDYINVGAESLVSGLSISGMGLTGSTAFAGIFATHRNSTTPVTYQFDSFSVKALANILWATATQNLLLENNNTNSQIFTIGLSNSGNSSVTYSLSVNYSSSAGWLNFNPTHSSTEPLVTFNYSEGRNLPVGIYYGTVTASATGFKPGSFTIQLRVVDPNRPYVISSMPINGTANVNADIVSIAANKLYVPTVSGYLGGVDNSTITNSSVKLFKSNNNIDTEITGVVQGSGGGDAISFSPATGLEAYSVYRFTISEQVKSLSGLAFAPFESTFTTGAVSSGSTNNLNVSFKKIPIPGTQNKSYTSLAIGPDDKFYALRLDGIIERYTINHFTGFLTNVQTIKTLVNKYGLRSAVGIAFDPSSTTTNVKVWISHCSAGLTSAPEFDGKISLLTGIQLENEQLVLTRLPRSTRDHLVNSLAFGPDGALYFNQGGNTSLGDYDPLWQRNETLLSAAVLRLDMKKIMAINWPLNVQTTSNLTVINNAPSKSRFMSDGTYNPYSSKSPLTIYASGVRNAFDLVWHKNGQLYVPTNGSGGGGNSPVSVAGTRRPDGTFYNGPNIPATKSVQVQPDHLFRINPLKQVGYFGHPNPKRGEYVCFRGYPDNPLYPSSVVADVNYRGSAHNFGLNISANGAIEYKSNAFGGRLKGKLIVCRFSGGGDLTVLEPGSMINSPNVTTATDDDRIYNIVRASTGSGNNGMVGMSAFVNPLDLTEDVQNGNLYVIEFNWSGDINLASQITLLQVDETSLTNTINTLATTEKELKKYSLGNQPNQGPEIRVYPNPVTADRISFELKNYKPRENILVTLYSLLGNVLKQEKMTTGDEGYLSSGFAFEKTYNDPFYILKITSSSGTKTSKILIR